MKLLVITTAILFSLTTATFAGELDIATDRQDVDYCSAKSRVNLSATTYGVITTLGLVLLLKKDDVGSLIEQSQTNGEVASELKSLVEQMKDEFKIKTGIKITSNEVLAQLQAQMI